jgi:predicted GNAT family acetyltransferase
MSMDKGQDDKLDETLDETFPASDAPANTVEVGIRTGKPDQPSPLVVDNPARQRLELSVDGWTAFLAYERTHDVFTLVHTEVPTALRGRHFGEVLVRAGLDMARDQGLRIAVVCPFARAYLRKHPGA